MQSKSALHRLGAKVLKKLYILGAVLCLLGMNFYWYSTEISFTSDKPLALTGFKIDAMFGGFKKAEIKGSIPYSFYDISFPLTEKITNENRREFLDERIYGRKPLPKHVEDNLFKYFRAVSFYLVMVGVLLTLLAEKKGWKITGGIMALLPLVILMLGISLLPVFTSAPEGIKMVVNTEILGGAYVVLAGGLLIVGSSMR